MIKYLYLVLVGLFLLIGCSQEDPFATRPEPTSFAILNPEVGGSNEQNQVYIDLSTQQTTNIKRDSWDLGFYTGESFKVMINPSIYMAIKGLDQTNIDAVTESDVSALYDQVAIGTFTPNNVIYVDGFEGDINNTALQINEIENENRVYLVNLGYRVGTEPSTIGSTSVSGEHRGWLKIKIFKKAGNYLLQYANISDETHQEIEISKNEEFNFTFFSFTTNSIVNVEPKKEKWDINFTVFMNEFSGFGTYGFTDFVLTNNKNNVATYQIIEEDIDGDTMIDNSFIDFSIIDVEISKFLTSQRTIGSNWRIGGGPGSSPHVKDDRYYIIKDAEGIFYKLKFLTMTNEFGERGNPQFEYKLLQ